MKRIGFIDYYLDEWHANTYPEMIRQASQGDLQVTCAYGYRDAPGGRTTEKWCQDMGIRQCAAISEVVADSDYLVVLSPDHPQMHWELCQEPLRSGKRTYVDKTFAPTLAVAKDLFSIAEESQTPIYSSSALAFSNELADLPAGPVQWISSFGPGEFSNYLIHQVEPIMEIFKENPLQVQYCGSDRRPTVMIQFPENRLAVLTLLSDSACDFAMDLQYADGRMERIPRATQYFERFIESMVRFFQTGGVPVPKERTVRVAAVLEAAAKAKENPGSWTPVFA